MNEEIEKCFGKFKPIFSVASEIENELKSRELDKTV